MTPHKTSNLFKISEYSSFIYLFDLYIIDKIFKIKTELFIKIKTIRDFENKMNGFVFSKTVPYALFYFSKCYKPEFSWKIAPYSFPVLQIFCNKIFRL